MDRTVCLIVHLSLCGYVIGMLSVPLCRLRPSVPQSRTFLEMQSADPRYHQTILNISEQQSIGFTLLGSVTYYTQLRQEHHYTASTPAPTISEIYPSSYYYINYNAYYYNLHPPPNPNLHPGRLAPPNLLHQTHHSPPNPPPNPQLHDHHPPLHNRRPQRHI